MANNNITTSIAIFTDSVGIQRELGVTHPTLNDFIDAGMPCLPNPKGGGLRFEIQECKEWYAEHTAGARLVSDRFGWSRSQSQEWINKHSLTFGRDGDGNAIGDEAAIQAAVKRDKAEFAAKRKAERAARLAEQEQAMNEAGSTEPDEELVLNDAGSVGAGDLDLSDDEILANRELLQRIIARFGSLSGSAGTIRRAS